jgi:ribonuclease VapC
LIVVDTSALMAILLAEPDAAACMAALESADRLLISAGTLAEALIVARRRRLGDLLDRLVAELGFEIAPVTPASARRVAAAYAKCGKGSHPAALNFGDCFAYELAQARACPLLWVGDDFARTDVTGVI